MILSKKVIFTSIIAAIAVVTIFAIQVISSYINSTSDTTQLEKGSMSIVFTREEMRRVSFGVVERFAAEKVESMSIQADGRALYTMQQGINSMQKEFRVPSERLKSIRSFINDVGLFDAALNLSDEVKGSDTFIRYTFTTTLDGSSKSLRWAESIRSDEFAPADVPPLLIRLRCMLMQIMSEPAGVGFDMARCLQGLS
ncbi:MULTISPECIES: hypothetical protein [Candidatus Nitrosocaldus]|jgi:hypothetical protein|uniref:Uncharacterized protein n=1 Tax=Candidatus Nitrosocaldus cavascurensis TaxID=2058097 RepID=A0A2K5ASJ2_9ARCH|nr:MULTISPECIES: hypothetical protein [Candidatus Nitrosocaldus]SPC34613.1 protein of unknown function [Candidatus Nitrosocaldus cavascurensis]